MKQIWVTERCLEHAGVHLRLGFSADWVLRDTSKLPLTHDKWHYVSRVLIVWESPRVAKRAGPVALI